MTREELIKELEWVGHALTGVPDAEDRRVRQPNPTLAGILLGKVIGKLASEITEPADLELTGAVG